MRLDLTKRRFALTLGAALVCAGLPASAQTAAEQVVKRLQDFGYNQITVRRTLLGRVRIDAIGPDGRREIILNPGTGAILRDYVERDEDSRSGSSRGGRDDDDDDRDDDDDDRDDDDDDNDDDSDDSDDDDNDDNDDNDNSGSGSGNSGSGGGGDDDGDDD